MASRTFFYKIVREIAVATVMAIAVSASAAAVVAGSVLEMASKAFSGIGAAMAAARGLIRAAFRPVLSAIAVVVSKISMMIAATSVTTAVSRLVSQIFSKLFLTQSSSRLSTTHYATPALLTVAFRCLKAVCSVVWNLCSKLKSSQISRIWCSIMSLLSRAACSLTFVKDFGLKTPALPSRSRYNRNHQQRHGSNPTLPLRQSNSGIIMVLVILFVPIIFAGIKYSQTLFERRQKIIGAKNGYYKKYDPKKVALNIAKVWNPSKRVAEQDLESIYEDAFDSTLWRQNNALGASIEGLIYENSDDGTTTNTPPNTHTSSAEKVEYAKKEIKVSVENDRIKVVANNNVAYALPKQCNLDLVLAIPTNSAAAVAEIGQGSANFLKDNFYYTRGVYASVIPYSGKLSLPSERYNGWTNAISIVSVSKLSSLTAFSNHLPLYDLYGTKSISGTSVTTYDGSGSSNGYSIMSRSSLFDATNASSSKYRRMNIAPCTSFGISNDDFTISSPVYTTFTANPHAIMEPVSDLSTTYNKCNGLTLPSDGKNTSSFIFAALEWANNMLQSWTTNPQKSVVAGGDAGILSSPAKTTSGRKKAIILVVNKPDTFTAGEMTYLGLSNDADQKWVDLDWKESDLPSSSDSHSWQSVCYGKDKFVAVANPSGYAVYSYDGIIWSLATLPSSGAWRAICYGKDKFVMISENSAMYSEDGTNWIKIDDTKPRGRKICYGGDKFVTLPSWSPTAAYSTDGIHWSNGNIQRTVWDGIGYGNGKFVACNGYYLVMYSEDGINWSEPIVPLNRHQWRSVCYGKNKFVVTPRWPKREIYSQDGINWLSSDLKRDNWIAICYGHDKFVELCDGTNIAAYSADGITWTESPLPFSANWSSVCYGDGKFVAFANGSNKAVYADKDLVVKTNPIGNTALKSALGDDGSTSGVTTLTTQACTKLKEAYGDDIRIYLIKYRKSSGDYAYLDTCATSTGGKSYDVADSASLKTTLDTIAADLKSWAGYTEARVVD